MMAPTVFAPYSKSLRMSRRSASSTRRSKLSLTRVGKRRSNPTRSSWDIFSINRPTCGRFVSSTIASCVATGRYPKIAACVRISDWLMISQI